MGSVLLRSSTRARAELLDEKGVDSTHSQLARTQNYSIEGAVSTKVDNRARAEDSRALESTAEIPHSRPRGG